MPMKEMKIENTTELFHGRSLLRVIRSPQYTPKTIIGRPDGKAWIS